MLRWVIKCTKSVNDRFTVGACYPVTDKGTVIDNYGKMGSSYKTDTFAEWYNSCGWYDYAFTVYEEFFCPVNVSRKEAIQILSKHFNIKTDLINIVD